MGLCLSPVPVQKMEGLWRALEDARERQWGCTLQKLSAFGTSTRSQWALWEEKGKRAEQMEAALPEPQQPCCHCLLMVWSCLLGAGGQAGERSAELVVETWNSKAGNLGFFRGCHHWWGSHLISVPQFPDSECCKHPTGVKNRPGPGGAGGDWTHTRVRKGLLCCLFTSKPTALNKQIFYYPDAGSLIWIFPLSLRPVIRP